MAAEEEACLETLQATLKKLEYEKAAAATLNKALQEDVRKLSKELAELKQRPRSDHSPSTAGPVSSTSESSSQSDGGMGEPEWVSEGGYQRVEQCCLYYHSESGYYYESVSRQFLAPTSVYQESNEKSEEDIKVADESHSDSIQSHSESTQSQSTRSHSKSARSQSESAAAPIGMTGDIASQLAVVSDKVTQSFGFVYDETSGLYYDQNTGLYYDQNNQLYYDADNGTYYSYDYDTRQYTIHSHVELPVKEYDPSEDICTIQSDPMDIKDRIIEEEKPTQLDLMFEDEEGLIPDAPPPMSEWPPCIRMIPQNVSSTKGTASELAGSQDARKCISLITAEGAVIGRDVTGPRSLRIIDLQVSKLHCEINYQKRREVYAITDCGSQNGTYINESRLSKPKEKSKPHLLQHGDYLKIGGTQFLLHIHRGMACCTDCSQLGITVVGAIPGSDESLEVQRRKGLNQIKKKYGLRMKDSYNDQLHKLPENYTDKAAKRRQKVGSDLPLSAIRDDEGASVNKSISASNKGHQMLKKIGWREGQSLGADNTGITQPISAVLHAEKAGLGYANSVRDMQSVNNPASGNHQKMVRRYQEALDSENKRKKFS